jgi:hypothetical protein
MAIRTVAESLTPVELACQHLRGNEDEDHPDCRRCHSHVGRTTDGNPSAFCAKCAYDVLDVLAKEIVRLDDSPELFAVQRRVAALEKELAESRKTRMLLAFISEMSLTVGQSAIGPLNPIQEQMLREIKNAARGTVPDWFIKDWEERSR